MNPHEPIGSERAGLLARKGDVKPVGDDDNLLVSARIDSVDLVELVSFLEQSFGVDFAARDVDPEQLESVETLLGLVAGAA